MVDAVESRRLIKRHQNCRLMVVEPTEDVVRDPEQSCLSRMVLPVRGLQSVETWPGRYVRNYSSKHKSLEDLADSIQV